jgi:hypothetical protein
MERILGVDPGLGGGLALIDGGVTYGGVWDMPVVRIGKGARRDWRSCTGGPGTGRGLRSSRAESSLLWHAAGMKESKRLHYDWTALREEWISRCMAGESLSIEAFILEADARFLASGMRVASNSTWRRQARDWHSELRRRHELVEEQLSHDSVLDVVEQRRRLVVVADRAHAAALAAFELYSGYLAWVRENQSPAKWGSAVRPADLKRLVESEVAARQAAGLPKSFDLSGEPQVPPGESPSDARDLRDLSAHARVIRELAQRRKDGGSGIN